MKFGIRRLLGGWGMGLRAQVLLCAATAWFAVVAPVQAQQFQLSGVEFSKSDYLPEAELDRAVAKYLNRDIEFSDVQKMIADVQALYLARGVVTARAIIEPQEVADGVLKITLVEARLDAVKVLGLKDTRPEFVTSRLSPQPGVKPDFEALARDLRLFEIAYDIRPKLSFSPGATPGTATAVVTVDEPRRLSWVASYDNSAAQALGSNQLSFSGTIRSLTGQRDTLSAKLALTAGSQALSLFYTRPVGMKGGKISTSATYTQSKIVKGAFSIVDVTSKELKFSTGYSQPLWIGTDRYWTASGDLNFERSNSQVAGAALQTTGLAEVDLSLSYQRQKLGQAWAASGGLKLGTVRSGNVSASDGFYYSLYGNVNYARKLGKRLVLDANLDLQYAEGQNLSVKRRFTGGGASTLRGYPKDARTGDSGAILRLQVNCPAPCLKQSPTLSRIAPFAFVDLGYIKPFKAAAAPVDNKHMLASSGLGMRMNFDKLALLGFIGVPLLATGGQPKPSPRLYLGADYAF